MSINVLKDYIAQCNVIGIEPSFKGLRAYREGVARC